MITFVPNSQIMFDESPYEHFTTFIEVDTGNKITVTANQVSYSGLDRSVTSYLYKDYGVDAFNEDFEFLFDIKVTDGADNGDALSFLELRNSIGNGGDVAVDKVKIDFFTSGGLIQFRLVEFDASSAYLDQAVITQGVQYYGKLTRDEAVGAHGTVYACLATSEANRDSETWAVSLSLALHTSKKDFRYLQVVTTAGDAAVRQVSGTVENLELVAY